VLLPRDLDSAVGGASASIVPSLKTQLPQ